MKRKKQAEPQLPFPETEAPRPFPLTLADIEALIEDEAWKRLRAQYCMLTQKLLVCRTWRVPFAQVNLPWEQWQELWQRFKRETGEE